MYQVCKLQSCQKLGTVFQHVFGATPLLPPATLRIQLLAHQARFSSCFNSKLINQDKCKNCSVFSKTVTWTSGICGCTQKIQCFYDNNGSCHFRNYSSKKPYLYDEFETPSPYKKPGPRDYGYEAKIMTGGLLPRSDKEKTFLQKHKDKDAWDRKHALFGQNDYVDILGDENVHPVQLIKGPPWLIGFRGNEYQRISRRMKFEGHKLKLEAPTEYHNIKKRLWFLYKRYNQRRVSKWK